MAVQNMTHFGVDERAGLGRGHEQQQERNGIIVPGHQCWR